MKNKKEIQIGIFNIKQCSKESIYIQVGEKTYYLEHSQSAKYYISKFKTHSI